MNIFLKRILYISIFWILAGSLFIMFYGYIEHVTDLQASILE